VALKLKDHLPEAIAEFKKAIELDPALADAYYALGVTVWQQGDFPNAADQLRGAIRAKPDYAEAHYTLGTVLSQMNQLAEAASELREAIRLQPDFAGAHTTLGNVLRKMGDTEQASAESRAGAEISKQKNGLQAASFTTNSGLHLLEVGDLEGAISQFRSAINSKPDYAPAHYQLGVALERKGERKEASDEFARASQLDSHLTRPLQSGKN
jgi:tetratricopeptide (TPR) repeat protein